MNNLERMNLENLVDNIQLHFDTVFEKKNKKGLESILQAKEFETHIDDLKDMYESEIIYSMIGESILKKSKKGLGGILRENEVKDILISITECRLGP